ncbi:MAG TPA: CopG family antitoxin [Gammaproteobacteria bacterium]|nr:CopG family antitoxin [Gammaproteobacteria bacterium]
MNDETEKDVPLFKNEAEEREFWEREDSSDRMDWRRAERVVFSNLKRPTSAEES